MPQLLAHIDAIARREHRDVLYLEFHPLEREQQRRYRHADDAGRDAVLAWLERHGIAWQACGPIADTRRQDAYRGQVWLDLPYDEDAARYRLLKEHLELLDGNMRIAGVRFYLMRLETAEANRAHDAVGFWDDWAAAQ
jgi:hypothetical protein